jgi:hypothetical protein
MAKRKTAAAVKRPQGTKEIRVAVAPNGGFDALVKVLRETLVVPEVPGFRGCRPCLSGLDRFIIEDPAFRQGQ